MLSGVLGQARLTRPGACLLVGLVLAVSAAACGSSGDNGTNDTGASTGTNDTGASTAGSESGEGITATAKEIINGGTEGWLYYDGPEGLVDPAKIEYLKAGDWKGPTSAPKPQAGKSIVVVDCLPGSGCTPIANAAVEAGKSIGWNMRLIQADGTPQGYAKALTTALSLKPDGIYVTAIPASQIADQLEKAKQQGIKTVAVSGLQVEGAQYDSLTPLLEVFTAQLEAYYAIADSDGTAKVAYIWDHGYPHLSEGVKDSEEIIRQCEGCEILESYKRDTATAVDAVATGNVVTSLLQKYGPDLQYILTPYGTGVDATVAAVQGAGRDDVKILTKNTEVGPMGLVAKGEVAADFGTSTEWAGYAGVDQMNRLLNGQDALDSWKQGMPVRVFDKANTPANGKPDWNEFIDFRSKYEEIWGISQ